MPTAKTTMVICESVYAELPASFPQKEELDGFLSDTGVRVYPSGTEALYLARQAWKQYLRRRPSDIICPKCGAAQAIQRNRCVTPIPIRPHLLTDLLVGAHAMTQADRLKDFPHRCTKL